MHCYFFLIILDNLIILCFLSATLFCTLSGLQRFSVLFFVIYGLVSRKTFTVVIIVLGLWSSICKDKNNFKNALCFLQVYCN